MSKTITIALDAMGGDAGPSVVLAGAELSRRRYPEIRYILHGEADAVLPELEKYPTLKEQSVFHPCDVSISMEEKPSQALRRGRRVSGMWKAIESVKNGEADVMVSAGNTGALMAMARFCLRMMPGIERPALAAVWPNVRGESIVLDVGATIGADAEQLVDFALMGSCMARALYDLDRPKVGLLNVGVEEVKGLEEVRLAGTQLKEIDLPGLEYAGFVEGDDIGRGNVDVIVTEGFSGNIALKTAEGTARQISTYLKDAMSRTLMARIGYLFASKAFSYIREKMDPRKVNGAVFLGLNGVVIKSHGSTDGEGFAAAIDVGHNTVRNRLQEKISADLARIRPWVEEDANDSAVESSQTEQNVQRETSND
ncbi:phosphate acyltransferase PlsX [Pseudahrensia aquimaris]|uniref:Phosphate acyltransferase n=1 Tax=Pseudahrensia aquimaris TaxID=744461 RepID=A0ABW3FB03_9HYPH